MDVPAAATKQQTIKAVPYGEQLLGMSVSPALVLLRWLSSCSYIQIRFKGIFKLRLMVCDFRLCKVASEFELFPNTMSEWQGSFNERRLLVFELIVDCAVIIAYSKLTH